MTFKVTRGEQFQPEVAKLCLQLKLYSIWPKSVYFTDLTFIGIFMTFKVTQGQLFQPHVNPLAKLCLQSKLYFNWSKTVHFTDLTFIGFMTFKVARGQPYFCRPSVSGP